MDLSIVIVNYNSKNYLDRCLSSIYDKTKDLEFEIIVVDNASNDNSRQLLKEKYPQVKLITNSKNLGFGKANNQGIDVVQGKYVLLLNNDTELINNALKIMFDFIEQHPEAGLVTCKLFEGNGQVQKNCRSFPLTPFDTMFSRASLMTKLFPNNSISQRVTLSDWNYDSRRQVDWVSGACMLIRREVLDRVGVFDDNYFMYWEDTDLCKRIRDAGWQIWFLPEPQIMHFTGKGGGKRSLKLRLFMMFAMHRSAYYYFLKHYYHNIFHPMAVLTFCGMLVLVAVKSFIELAKSLPE